MDPDFIRCWRDADDANNTRVYYNITNDQWNCAEHYGKCDSCPKLQGDPDIAGIGVIVAFMVSCGLTSLLGTVFYTLASVIPRRKTIARASFDVRTDKILSKYVLEIFGRQRAVRWATICYDMVMCLGDQQLSTSTALLVATLKKLHVDKDLSVYHLRLVVSLVLVSSTASLYAMLSWRIKHEGYVKTDVSPASEIESGSQPSEKLPRERFSVVLRAFLVLALAALLLYTGLVKAKTRDLDKDCPAVCFHIMPFDASIIGAWLENSWIYVFSTITLGYLQWSSIQTSLSTFRKPERDIGAKYASLSTSGRQTPKETSQDVNTFSRRLGKFCKSLATSSLSCFVLTNIYFTVFFIGTASDLHKDHRSIYARGIKDEAGMGFGQIVPLFLLIQPILQFFDSIAGTRVDTETNNEVESGADNRTNDRTDNRTEEDSPEDIV